MPFCSHCGKEVSEDGSFCPNCGDRLKKGFTPLVVWGYVCGIAVLFMVLWGYIGFEAVFIFPIGFGIAGVVIGIINLTKGRVGHGIAQIVIAVTLGILGVLWGANMWGN